MPDVIAFTPTSRGFRFVNDWPTMPDKMIDTPLGEIAIGDASNGLCGGMVFAVRDYFGAAIMCPSGKRPNFGHPLYNFIVDRLFASFDLPNGPTKYYDWMVSPDHDTWASKGLARRTIVEEWPKIKADLDGNKLSCLALVTVASPIAMDMGRNHQVLAYGYDLSGENTLTLKVYDPNTDPDDGDGDGVRISLSLNDPSHTTPIAHNVNIKDGERRRPIRGFFHVPYTPVAPPQFDDADIVTSYAPVEMPAKQTAPVTVRVRNTGTTSWASGGANPYRLGAHLPQDNTRWGMSRVELPDAVSPTQTVDFTFTVTAPDDDKVQVPMGWRMVREFVNWFGETAKQTVDVYRTAPNPCDQLHIQITDTLTEITDLQAELKTAEGSEQKANVNRRIPAHRKVLDELRNKAAAQGCSHIP